MMFQKKTINERRIRAVAEVEWNNQHKSIIWPIVSLVIFLLLVSATVYCAARESSSHNGTIVYTAGDGTKWVETYNNFPDTRVFRYGNIEMEGKDVSVVQDDTSNTFWLVMEYSLMGCSTAWLCLEAFWNYSKKNKFIKQYVHEHTVFIEIEHIV
jgi:hypothetical protein